MRRSRIAGLVAALAVVGPAGAALAGWLSDSEPSEGTQRPQTTIVSDLAVEVARAESRLVARQDTTYTIAVTNHGDTARELTVRAVVPPWLATVAPPAGSRPGDGYVDWSVTVPPGEATTVQLTGAYARPGGPVPDRVAFTACALAADTGEPVVCTTDLGQLHRSWWGTWWWLVSAAGIAVAGTAAVVLLRRYRRHPRSADLAPLAVDKSDATDKSAATGARSTEG